MPLDKFPDWWDWDLEVSPHLLRRMEIRQFNESDLREMLEDALGFQADPVPGRWKVESRWRGRPWEIIVEPDQARRRAVVVTAYMVE